MKFRIVRVREDRTDISVTLKDAQEAAKEKPEVFYQCGAVRMPLKHALYAGTGRELDHDDFVIGAKA